jgi:hypothetical protein
MKRMQALRLMPSHTYFYKKLTQFGKDHDKVILSMVENEGKRMTAVRKIGAMQEEEDKEPLINEDNGIDAVVSVLIWHVLELLWK